VAIRCLMKITFSVSVFQNYAKSRGLLWINRTLTGKRSVSKLPTQVLAFRSIDLTFVPFLSKTHS
jgi:hypothetical protein